MLRVRFTADARADLNDALNWYETHAPEIASQFRNALSVVVARIAENPRRHRHVAYEEHERRMPQRFSSGRDDLAPRTHGRGA